MKLTDAQLQSYLQNGFLLIENCFSSDEIQVIKSQIPEVFHEDSPRRVLEKDGVTVRSVYGSHQSNVVFELLSRHPSLAEPAMQILESPSYVYQFKINAKAALAGDVWEWHQDYIFWRNEDGMPMDHAINAVVYLDEVNEFNGPLLVVPGSHTIGVVEPPSHAEEPMDPSMPDWTRDLTADLKFSIPKDVLIELARARGIESTKGPVGSVLFFHPNLVHGSAPNMYPFARNIIIITYNSTLNIPNPGDHPRPEYLANVSQIAPLTLADADSICRFATSL